MEELNVNEVEKDEAEVKEDAITFTPQVTPENEEPPCARRIYARRRASRVKPKVETPDERLERIIKHATPPVRPPIEGGLDPDECERRMKRTLTVTREHLRRIGAKHPTYDKDYGKEVND